ncbi:oxygen-insensitive NADPH nitroreductase family protein [Xylariaceae sp. FL1651]|nr:oxygen-insensitive NADPH nitroreductase family protein [Xylariaceae sp. FL1651]
MIIGIKRTIKYSRSRCKSPTLSLRAAHSLSVNIGYPCRSLQNLSLLQKIDVSCAFFSPFRINIMADIPRLIRNRYGNLTDALALDSHVIPQNPTLETLLQHRSVRHFLPEKLPQGSLEVIVAAAQSAATSSNLQTWSVLALEDAKHKDKAATLCGNQDFIRNAPLFLIFCADLDRLTKVSAQHELRGEGLEFTEMFLMASLDAGLAGQNAAIAAESLGLGVCYAGAARNKPRELAELLKLPPRVLAVFGLAVGKPDPAKSTSVKPRLPQKEVLHRETWCVDANGDNNQTQAENLKEYDVTLASYNAGEKREGVPAWTQRSARRIETVESLHGRHVLKDVLQQKGFNMR